MSDEREQVVPRNKNVVLITTDQHRADCIGVEGRPVHTPHLDRLASQGTRFSLAITPNPVCQPARASILTGLLPLTHGAWDNGVDLDPAVGETGFAGQLAHHGYRTAMIGKAHFSTHNTFHPTGRPECRLSNRDYPPSWRGPYMGFEHVELIAKPHAHAESAPVLPPDGLHYEDWLYRGDDDYNDEMARLLFGARDPHDRTARVEESWLPPAWHSSTWCADRTISFLNDVGSSPFAIWTSFPDPHLPFDCPPPWDSLHHPDSVDLPPHRTRDLAGRPWWHRASLERVPHVNDPGFRSLRSNISRVPQLDDRQLRRLIANYYGMISLVDHNVGRILLALEDLGLSDSTLVVFTSDHGEWLGDHGLVLKGPMPYDGLIRVPLIVQGGGVRRGAVVDEPVATTDLAPTLYDFCDVPSSESMHGQTLMPLLGGRPQARGYAYNEWDVHESRCGVRLRLRTIRTRRYRMTVELESGAGELYDFEEDPHEMVNLFDDPQRRAARGELMDLIRCRPDDARQPLADPVGIG